MSSSGRYTEKRRPERWSCAVAGLHVFPVSDISTDNRTEPTLSTSTLMKAEYEYIGDS